MTEADLDRIETTLRTALPQRYLDFALRLPDLPDDDDAHRWYPFMDADEIISRNQQFRSGDLVDGWKPELFCIGTFEGGDYFVDLSDLDKGIFVDHSNAGCDELGGLYDPSDYSACRISSFDEFVDE